MVIERFKRGDPRPVERFRQQGRMMPDGVVYVNSWIEPAAARCFQAMEAPDRGALQAWIDRRPGLVEFEVIPVQMSAQYWATVNSGR